MDNSLNTFFSSMETQLHSLLFTNFLTFLLILLLNSVAATPNTAVPATTGNPLDFIRSSCNNATLYPDLCYTSLSPFANSIEWDPLRLALSSIHVTLSVTLNLSNYLTDLAHHGPTPKAAVVSALKDCCSTFGDSVDQMRGSMRRMRELAGESGPGSEEMRFKLSDVLTWMSAALTNEGTCMDGFADVDDCPIKDGVTDRVGGVTKLTSNALALVNSFANSVGS